MANSQRSHYLELIALALILLLAAYLRFANVATNPAWYADEGTHLDIVRQLLAGRVQYLAINQSWLMFSRLPLFEALLALLARLNGASMETLRSLTAGLGTITVAALYFVAGRISRDRVLALLAALLLAIYPPAVLYSRFGFSYNLLAPLLLFALLGLWEYTVSPTERNAAKSKDVRRRWLAMAALSIGLGTISDVWAFVLVVPLILCVSFRNWRDLLWSIPLALLPFFCYTAIMLLTVPQAFLFDARFVLSRLNQLSLDQQMQTLWQNTTTLAMQDVWMILSVIGLLLLRPARGRWLTLAFLLIPIVLLGRTAALFSLSYYYLIPLLPIVALGVASLIRFGVPWATTQLRRLAQRRTDRVRFNWLAAMLAVPIAFSLLMSTANLTAQVHSGFRTDIDSFLLGPTDVQRAVDFINSHTDETDLVIGSPALVWALRADRADMQMPIAAMGRATPHLPADISVDRWAFDPNYQRARYVVVDNLWRNWAVPNVPGVASTLKDIEAWPLVLKSGEVAVYQNPEKQ